MAAKTTPRSSARKPRTGKSDSPKRSRAVASTRAAPAKKRTSSRAATRTRKTAVRKKRSSSTPITRTKVVKAAKKVMKEERTRIGAIAGGSTGAMIGAVVGPIGAAVGAAIGAVAGSLADASDHAGREKPNSNGTTRKPTKTPDTRKKQ